MTQLKYTDLMKPEDISVWKCWLLYSRGVFPEVKSDSVQYSEMRRAFYVGFMECFKVMNDLSEALPEEQAAGFLSKINQEIHDFFEKELAGPLKELRGKK